MIRYLILGLLLSNFVFSEPPLITTVGKIQDDFITSRDVLVSGWIENILYPVKSAKQKELPVVSSGQFSRLLNSFLLEEIVSREAKNFSAVKVSQSEIEDGLSTLRKKLPDSKSMRDLEVSEAELKQRLAKKLAAKKFIRFKAESSVVSVTDAEARQYFEQNRLKFGDLPFENFKENIKVFLTREQVDKRLRDWFEVLQSKYKVESYKNEGV